MTLGNKEDKEKKGGGEKDSKMCSKSGTYTITTSSTEHCFPRKWSLWFVFKALSYMIEDIIQC